MNVISDSSKCGQKVTSTMIMDGINSKKMAIKPNNAEAMPSNPEWIFDPIPPCKKDYQSLIFPLVSAAVVGVSTVSQGGPKEDSEDFFEIDLDLTRSDVTTDTLPPTDTNTTCSTMPELKLSPLSTRVLDKTKTAIVSPGSDVVFCGADPPKAGSKRRQSWDNRPKKKGRRVSFASNDSLVHSKEIPNRSTIAGKDKAAAWWTRKEQRAFRNAEKQRLMNLLESSQRNYLANPGAALSTSKQDGSSPSDQMNTLQNQASVHSQDCKIVSVEETTEVAQALQKSLVDTLKKSSLGNSVRKENVKDLITPKQATAQGCGTNIPGRTIKANRFDPVLVVAV